MRLSEIYCKKILLSADTKNELLNERDPFPYRKNQLFFIVYLIENYFRPKVTQNLELFLLRVGLLKDPSIGPFQIKYSKLGTNDLSESNLWSTSLDFLDEEMKKFHLFKNPSFENFLEFGKFYNGTTFYGEVMFQLYNKFTETSGKQASVFPNHPSD